MTTNKVQRNIYLIISLVAIFSIATFFLYSFNSAIQTLLILHAENIGIVGLIIVNILFAIIDFYFVTSLVCYILDKCFNAYTKYQANKTNNKVKRVNSKVLLH